VNRDYIVQSVLDLAQMPCQLEISNCVATGRSTDNLCRPCWARMVVDSSPRPHTNDIALAFDQFWELCPRKIAKGAARKAFLKAAQKASLDSILSGMAQHADEIKSNDPMFIPYPASWLNAERWEDETVTDDSLARMRAEMERRGYRES